MLTTIVDHNRSRLGRSENDPPSRRWPGQRPHPTARLYFASRGSREPDARSRWVTKWVTITAASDEQRRTLTDDSSQVKQLGTVVGRANDWLWEQEARQLGRAKALKWIEAW